MKYNNIIFKYFGFTILEIVIVLLILATIATFALPSYRKFQEKSVLSKAKIMLFNYNQELQTYNLKYSFLPSTADEYKDFEKQMKINPNDDDDNNKYYKVAYNAETNSLVTIPQINNPFHSCIQMNLNTHNMQQCTCQVEQIQTQKCQNIED